MLGQQRIEPVKAWRIGFLLVDLAEAFLVILGLLLVLLGPWIQMRHAGTVALVFCGRFLFDRFLVRIFRRVKLAELEEEIVNGIVDPLPLREMPIEQEPADRRARRNSGIG